MSSNLILQHYLDIVKDKLVKVVESVIGEIVHKLVAHNLVVTKGNVPLD